MNRMPQRAQRPAHAFDGTYGFEEDPRDLHEILEDSDHVAVQDASELLHEYNIGPGADDE